MIGIKFNWLSRVAMAGLSCLLTTSLADLTMTSTALGQASEPTAAPAVPVEPQGQAVEDSPLTFTTVLDYSNCLEDILQLSQNREQFKQRGRRSDCLTDLFRARIETGLSGSQTLQLIEAANAYATSLRPRLFPPRGQRLRIAEQFGFIYEIDAEDLVARRLAAQSSPPPRVERPENPTPTPTPTPGNDLAEQPSFFCGVSANVPTTMVKIQQIDYPLLSWTRALGLSASERCEAVSGRLQTLYRDGTLRYLTTGTMDGSPVICAAQELGLPCRDLIVTLAVSADAERALSALLERQPPVSRADTPISARASGRLYIDVAQYLGTTRTNATHSTPP